MRTSSVDRRTIRKEQARVLQRESTGADRGPGGREIGARSGWGAYCSPGARGAAGTPTNLLKWRGEEKKGFKRGEVLPKRN